eukprot:11224862-Lingulodinium_polyedra.AAC.1
MPRPGRGCWRPWPCTIVAERVAPAPGCLTPPRWTASSAGRAHAGRQPWPSCAGPLGTLMRRLHAGGTWRASRPTSRSASSGTTPSCTASSCSPGTTTKPM